MPLAEGQVQIRDLIIGPGTPYRFVKGQHFNPFNRAVRADQGGARAWAHGSWSGAEWAEQVAVPMRLVVLATGAADYADRLHDLLAAFAPSSTDLELTFCLGGVEYLMRGRPRMVDPESRHIDGHVYVQAAWVALDPGIYSATQHQVQVGLPIATGGLTLPVAAPFSIEAEFVSGRRPITNAGTRDTGLQLRVDGPVETPQISLLTDAGTTTLRVHVTVESGQWLDIDTAARTVYLNGMASRRGKATGSWPVLPPGTAEVAFAAASYEAAARLTVQWRDAWH